MIDTNNKSYGFVVKKETKNSIRYEAPIESVSDYRVYEYLNLLNDRKIVDSEGDILKVTDCGVSVSYIYEDSSIFYIVAKK